LDHANPFDPIRPVRMVAARGGLASGQVVLSGPGPLSEVRASIGTMRGPDGERMPADALQIRYAAEQEGARYFDALMTEPPESPGATQPVWVLVDVPRNQQPGWYTGTLDVAGGGEEFTVPVQLLISAWTLPEPRKGRTWAGVLHSPDTIARYYDVEPLSDEHFARMEPTIEMLGQLGNNVLYIPVVHDTHMGHETGFVRFVEGEDGYEPEFSALERYFEMWDKHVGEPDVICLIVWKPQFGSRALFRGAQRQEEEPIMVTKLDPDTGEMTPMRAPMYGAGEFAEPEHLGRGVVPTASADEDAEAFWKAVIEGTRQTVRKQGWSEESVMLGQGFDSRPLREQVEFFNRIDPGIRWVIFSHWIRDPGPEDGKLFVSDGMEVGYRETQGRASAPELTDEWPNPPTREYFVGGANRSDVLSWSGPTSYRNLGRRGNVARIGLDFWRVQRPGGRHGRLFSSGICGSWLYKSNPVNVIAPGPDGAVPTVRFQMLREGLQETELRIHLAAQLPELDEDKQQQIQALMEQHRQSALMAGRGLDQMQLSFDWLGLNAKLMAAAVELAGESEPGSWDDPPQP
ncbi:MAG: glycoside hydrolase domain-containing protein, partial [Planctomycetota bacterium]